MDTEGYCAIDTEGYSSTIDSLDRVTNHSTMTTSLPCLVVDLATRMRDVCSNMLSLLGLVQSPSPSPGVGVMLEKMVLDHHRTMFYTATVSPSPQTVTPAKPNPKTSQGRVTANKLSPTLKVNLSKWQCASSISKSKTVVKRTNTNSPQYYTLTFMEEEEESR
jgi:hypothetical protein